MLSVQSGLSAKIGRTDEMAKVQNERIHFRLLHMECCGHLLCWVNPRFPTHCPECGETVYPQCRSWATVSDPNAHLKFTIGEGS